MKTLWERSEALTGVRFRELESKSAPRHGALPTSA
jgi:hypothetical protein